jgi:hypothetical protein
MDNVNNVRIIQAFDGSWGVCFSFNNGPGVIEYVGSMEDAIKMAAKMRKPPVLTVIEGGKRTLSSWPERKTSDQR